MKTRNHLRRFSALSFFKIRNTTMKLCATTLLLLAVLASARGQGLRAGIIAGVTSSDIKVDRSFRNIVDGKNIYGFEAGFFIQPRLGPIYMKPQLLYDYRSGDVNFSGSGDNGGAPGRFSIHTLEVPVLFGVCFCPVFIEGGPVYNYMLGATRVIDGNAVSLEKSGLGYRVGLGLDFKVIALHAHYQGITYQASQDRATFRDPSRLIFGLSINTAGNHQKKKEPAR